MDNFSGQAIKGYELNDLLGAGGFGAVYRAYQPLVKRDVAMKIILPEYANHPEFIRRFEFEAQLIARLEHIHIVPLYDYWRQPDGAFLIMRLLRGGSLRGKLKEGPIEVLTAVRVAEQIASALSSAHRRGVVHRDIKPDNILFDEDGNAYLADFGIAKDLREAKLDGESSTYDEGALTGSPFYLSPEQAQSLPITPQTDLYSLGIVLYEMLVGEPPFRSDQGLIAILLQHINDPVPSVLLKRPDLSPAVDMVIQRATAKEPASRYGDANSLANDFRRALIGVDSAVKASGPFAREEVTPLDEVLVITKPLASSTLIIVPPAEVTNPYKGLQPFQEADSADFFGRDMLIEKLIERMQEPGDISRFLAVIGPSGSGKSSVVKAGLIPAIRRGALPNSDRWYLTQMVPGSDPFREMANALLGVAIDPPQGLLETLRTDKFALVNVVEQILPPGEENGLLLTIDQFEEVFTLVEDEAARAHFLELLLMAVAQPGCRFRLIITLRADFYDRPLLYPGFGEMVRRRNEVVLPLSADEMREAIVGPAEHAGVSVEAGLVAAIVAEIAEQPGALPLLQYALTEVFERRQENVLTLQAYHDSGGVLGALARRAEELYQQTDAEGQEAMRQVFIRLVNLSEGSENTRRRAMQHELMTLVEDEKVVNRVIDSLGKYRLLTFDHDPDTRAPTVAVAHEALIREWKRLRQWLDDSREDILLQRRLASANEEWQKQRRDPSFLASGVRLQQFESLVQRATIALTPEEVEYVKSSVVQREAREAEERARAAREEALEKRSRDRLRALAVVMAIAAVITSVLAVSAFASFRNAEHERKNADSQRKIAIEQRGIAERSADVSDSLALAASAQTQFVSQNRDLALALALAANQISDPPSQSQFILAQTAFSPGTRRVLSDPGAQVLAVAFTSDGKQAISGDDGGQLLRWNLATGEIVRRYEGHKNVVRSVKLSPDGTTMLSADSDGLMLLWNIETGEIIHRFEGQEGPVRAIAFTPDGKSVLSAPNDNTVLLWSVETGEIVRKFEGHTAAVRGIDVSPDGKTVISASNDTTLKLWNLETGEVIRTFEGHTDVVSCVAFSPDGKTMLSGSGDLTVRLWDVTTGQEIRRFQGHGNFVKSVAYSPGGQIAVSSADDNTIRLWNIETGIELDRLIGHSDFVQQAVFSPDGYQILSGSGDSTLRLWDLTNGAEIRRFRGHTRAVLNVAITPDGKTALTAGFDGVVYIWNLETGERIGEFDGHLGKTYVSTLTVSPDGKYALSSDEGGDYTLLEWDIKTGAIVQRFAGHTGRVRSAVFSPDGKWIVSGSEDMTIIVWDAQTGQVLHTLAEYQDYVISLAFNPAGTRLISSSEVYDSRLIVWDTATWQPLRTIQGGQIVYMTLGFSPDGSQFAAGLINGNVMIWNAETGEQVQLMQGHTAPLEDVVFSPDGKALASASDDGTIRLWDVATGQELRQLDNGQPVYSLAYSANGQAILSASADSTVRLWDVSPLTLDRLLAWVPANRYVPELTCFQREQFRITPLCDKEGKLPSSGS